MRQTIVEALTWALALDPATLKWPAAVLVALCFGLVLFGLVQYQAFNRLWGLHLVLGLAGGAVVAGLGAATHWLLGVLYGVGYVLTWLVWVLTRRWRWWRRALARGLSAGLTLGPWLWVGATEKHVLASGAGFRPYVINWLLAPTGLIWFWMSLGALWLLVLVGGWDCWSWPQRVRPPASDAGEAQPSRRRLIATWVVLGFLGLIWYSAGRVDLWAACESQQHWRLRFLLVARPGCQWYRPDFATPLHSAAAYGNADGVRLLLATGAKVHAKDNLGQTPLHWAASDGQIETLRLLLAAGADVHAKDNFGETPLHRAAWIHNVEALRVLLAAGARVNERLRYTENADGTALDIAKDDKDCSTLLRQAGGKTGKELDAEKPAAPTP